MSNTANAFRPYRKATRETPLLNLCIEPCAEVLQPLVRWLYQLWWWLSYPLRTDFWDGVLFSQSVAGLSSDKVRDPTKMNDKLKKVIDECMGRILGEAQELIEAKRPYLATFTLPKLLLESLLGEALQLRSVATLQRRRRNVVSTEFSDPSSSHSSSCAGLIPMVKHNLSIVTCDKIRKGGTIDAFYVATTELMQKLIPSGIFPPKDEFSPINLNFMNSAASDGSDDDDELGDHFDGVDFVLVVLLQKSDGGGQLRVCKQNIPESWTDEQRQTFAKQESDQCYPNSLELDPSTGSLYILNGRCNLHAVLPPRGQRERISLIMSFYRTPNRSFARHFGSFYGKTQDP